MQEDVLFFFKDHMDALPLYETFEDRVGKEIPDVRLRVQSSQISFYNRHMFSCISFLRVKKKKDMPEKYIVVTFGLPYRAASSRIAAAIEPYPNRWTHHVVVSKKEDIDDELMAWVREAADFSASK